MLVFKAISLINDLTETGQKDSRRETYLGRGTNHLRWPFRFPPHQKRCRLLCLYSTFFFFFPPAIDLSVWCLWNNWSNPLRLTGGETAAGSFSSSPDREMVGSYLRNFWFSFHPLTAAVFVTGLHGHPKLHRGSADAVNLERIQPKRAPAIVTISKAYSTMQISHQMSHVTVSCCFHRKLLKISEILHK